MHTQIAGSYVTSIVKEDNVITLQVYDQPKTPSPPPKPPLEMTPCPAYQIPYCK